MELPNSLTLPELSIGALLGNLLLGIVLSLILCWHFNHRAKIKVLRRDLALVLPVLCLTTLLVISVVKSSLALSLGLVGALSIVRFRTPIKEPEELAYIFLAIAMGLALGADQREVATIALPIILVVISGIDYFKNKKQDTIGDVLLTLEVLKMGNEVEEVITLLESSAPEMNIRRIDQDEKTVSVVCLIKIKNKNALLKFCTKFESVFPKGRFSIIDDSSFPNE